jgi:hypothetical protein
MEKALRYELEQHITELVGQIYPTHAPEGATKPYLVYARINTDTIETLQGYTNKQALSYMFSIMAVKYGDMKSLTDRVEALLKSFPLTSIGLENIYIEQVKINNVTETWENALGVNRGIIDFTIYF